MSRLRVEEAGFPLVQLAVPVIVEDVAMAVPCAQDPPRAVLLGVLAGTGDQGAEEAARLRRILMLDPATLVERLGVVVDRGVQLVAIEQTEKLLRRGDRAAQVGEFLRAVETMVVGVTRGGDAQHGQRQA
jgi:hypothetical protein